jgi:hypothetical protein
MRKGLEYWEDNWKGLLGNIMKQASGYGDKQEEEQCFD